MKSYETEQKFRIKDPSLFRHRLKALRARKIRSGKEYNEFLDLGGWLSRKKRILRLRRQGDHATLTLKGGKIRARYTKRLDLETVISFNSAKAILRDLGFRVVKRYAKKREEYRLSFCKVTLDYLPKFGWFSEIEGSPGRIGRLSRKLGFRKEDREERSYLRMLFGWRK